MIELSSLERKYGDFYVPAFKVEVDGQDLVRELYLTVTGVEVDLKQKAAGRFTFTVANSFDWKKRGFAASNDKSIDLIKLFTFGKNVKVFFGYGDATGLTLMLQGIITELATSFSEGGTPELTVSGYDELFQLSTGKSSRHWEKKRDSEVVSDLVAITSLSRSITQTDPVKNRIDMTQESELAFLTKIAERNAATFYVRGEEFFFGPRKNDKTAQVSLGWGKGLLTFSPEANLARQVQAVEVHGRSIENGEPILGKASAGDETGTDASADGGAETVAAALNTKPTMRVRAAVHTQAEADERARAILEERSQEFVKGSGDCIGLPEIVPDINVALTDLGSPFSKTYYVDSARHKVDGGGYRTSFTVKETGI